MKKKYVVILIVSIFLTACSGANNQALSPKESSIFQIADVENAKITSNSCNVKDGVGNNFKTVGNLKKNQVVDVLRQVGDWYVIQMDDNKIGCIDSSEAKPIVVEKGEGSENVPTKKQPKAQTPQPQQQQQPQETPEPQQSQQQTDVNDNQQSVSPPTALSTQENQMVNLVNKEREKNNLPPLEIDLELARVSRIKSQDMVDKNYFSHYSPTYGSPFEMMDSFGIKYLHAGENLAGNSTVQRAHQALMNSSGHRKNILSPNFTHVGIGIKPSDKYGYIYTQMFISKPK